MSKYTVYKLWGLFTLQEDMMSEREKNEKRKRKKDGSSCYSCGDDIAVIAGLWRQ
ncbi:MAG: hypothetical protein ACI4DZ_07585 [Oliverpabstia sp.]